MTLIILLTIFSLLEPTGPPSNVKAENTSSSSLKVTFKSIPFEHRRGIIIGYIIYYQTSDKFGVEPSLEYDVPDPRGTIREAHLRGLELKTNYSVEVAGYTSKGIGLRSKTVFASTGDFGMYLKC